MVCKKNSIQQFIKNFFPLTDALVFKSVDTYLYQ